VRLAPGFFANWHNADHRRYVIPIRGQAEIEVAGGEKTYAEPGRIFVAEDLTGKGHTFRVVSKDDWVALFIEFAQ
jgi:quercetin dioxygenase-like cupin family protein